LFQQALRLGRETVSPATPSDRTVAVRKLLRATLVVKRETGMTGELWAAFTAAGAAFTLAEIANSRVHEALFALSGKSAKPVKPLW
jgi:hypothetical protein